MSVNVLGVDPTTGFANRPLDNTGVQYGLLALRDGAISVDQFLDVNAGIGGYDIDGNIVASREAIDAKTAAIASHALRSVVCLLSSIGIATPVSRSAGSVFHSRADRETQVRGQPVRRVLHAG